LPAIVSTALVIGVDELAAKSAALDPSIVWLAVPNFVAPL
jgi:hypothetical protein